ncbi:Class II abasic (AP) endonuclease [Zalaria obscura]|uniref:Class II abasic (AP) endonuclease n=1 Tax=Zalaria obscura TaxID=2024903 RepID=A0ACC3S9X6_9PEZI
MIWFCLTDGIAISACRNTRKVDWTQTSSSELYSDRECTGYSGVGIYTRNATCAPIRAEEGLLGVLCPPGSKTQYRDLHSSEHIGGYPSELQIAELGVDPALLDSEGRCVCLEFPAFVLFGVYSPANSNGLRDDFRYGFICALDCRIRNLVKMGKRVVLVGDLNVSRSELDTASAAEDIRKAGMTHEDYISTPNRRIFNQLIVGGDVVGERDEGREEGVLWDVVRGFYPERKGMYTHWEQKVNARPGNYGSRIDYVLASVEMKDWFSDGNIQEGLMGSDHCPVYGDFKDVVEVHQGAEIRTEHMIDIMNPPGVFVEGKRQKEWTVKDVPVFSGKLLPEFDKRRSIKDMFKRTNTGTKQIKLGDENVDTPPSNGDSAPSETPTATSTPQLGNGSPVKVLAPQAEQETTSLGKRKSMDAPSAKLPKRQKSETTTTLKAEPPKGQKSLKGFFAPKPKPSPTASPVRNGSASTPHASTTDTANGEDSDLNRAIQASLRNDSASVEPTQATTTLPPPSPQQAKKPEPPPPPSPASSIRSATSASSTVHDPIVAKESWGTLFRKPAPPLCEGHSEPCKSMLTKKKGENQGRSFWMCARPLGPSGAKEKGTQWRCGTFVWCSDWKGEGQG